MKISYIIAVLAFIESFAVNAALIDRGGGLIYDTDLNITWLANANYGRGSWYDNMDGRSDGAMRWDNAVKWANSLSYYDSVRDATYSDWRLPHTMQPDPNCSIQINAGVYGLQGRGYNCIGSELGHLFYSDLGQSAEHLFMLRITPTTVYLQTFKVGIGRAMYIYQIQIIMRGLFSQQITTKYIILGYSRMCTHGPSETAM